MLGSKKAVTGSWQGRLSLGECVRGSLRLRGVPFQVVLVGVLDRYAETASCTTRGVKMLFVDENLFQQGRLLLGCVISASRHGAGLQAIPQR